MAKKNRAASRSTKTGQRRPAMKRKSRRKSTTVRPKGVEAKGEAGGIGTALGVGASTAAATGHAAGTSTATSVGVFDTQQIARPRRNLSAPVQSTIGGAEPPFPLRAAAQTIEPPHASLELSTTPPEVRIQGVGAAIAGSSTVEAVGIVLPAPAAIMPTVYPDSPQGTIIVQNHVTINIQADEFKRFNKNIEALIGELRQSNEISGEVRDQLLSELKAGRELLTGPKPQHDLIDLLLVKPLKYLIDKSGSAIIGKLAWDALAWLLRMLA